MSQEVNFEVLLCNTQSLFDAAARLVAEYYISIVKPDFRGPVCAPEMEKEIKEAESIVTHCDATYVVTIDGVAVGVACASTDDGDAYFGHLLYLYVVPEHRCKGIGTDLLDQIERYFEEEKRRKIKISVYPADETALPFLEKRGYWHSHVVMKKRIKIE